jgi:cytochrome b subunit of formate dehydrogenase
MLAHNIVDFIKKAKIKKLRQSGMLIPEHTNYGLYLRMTLDERIQHIALAVSFITLVITGFMLHFPDAWWVSHIRDLSSDAFEYRSILHRIAAVVLMLVSVYHIVYVSATDRGRRLIKDLFPKYEDLLDAVNMAKFNLGISKNKPMLDRFSYVEKTEYWALIWGTIVMSVTGVIMWFDNTFIGLLTKLGWDIARTIHYFEAWLAFLAIVFWHFYFVIFNPSVYPMNLSWLTGKIPEEEMQEEHAKEYERISKERNENSFKEENREE